MRFALVFGFVSLAVAACTSSSTNDGSLTICRNLPSSNDCSVNLAYLSCTYFDDAGAEQTELCLSDNINQCPDGNGLDGECTSECNTGEYGAICSASTADAAAQSVTPPSSSCRLLPNSNAYCCPCGS